MNAAAYSPKNAARFYVPLLLQAFSQSLTYPLVGAIISHGPDGVDALTAFSLGQVIQFMIGALAGGLVMTGMVFAKTSSGLASFRRLNFLMMAVLLSAAVHEAGHAVMGLKLDGANEVQKITIIPRGHAGGYTMSNIDMWQIEREHLSAGLQYICGVDEAGRGPLAGPVCAAAVILPPHIDIPGLNDSKKLTDKIKSKF